MNVCNFSGHLVRDIELKKTKNDNSVVNFSIAVKNFIKDSGPEVHYFDFEAWGSVAEMLAEGGYKGRHMNIFSQAKNHSWQTQNENGEPVTRKAVRFRATGFEWMSYDPAKFKKAPTEQSQDDELPPTVSASVASEDDDYRVNF
jgi:single-stranded DNA-binding protein